jgi:hypothetical protein
MDSEPDGPLIRIDGVDYPLVALDDMTLGERVEFERVAGDGVDKLAEMQERYRDGLLVAWMAVSIRRAKPDVPIGQIVARLSELKQADLDAAWTQAKSDEPPLVTPPEPSSPVSPQKIELGFNATTADDLASGLRRAIGVLSSASTSTSDPATLNT